MNDRQFEQLVSGIKAFAPDPDVLTLIEHARALRSIAGRLAVVPFPHTATLVLRKDAHAALSFEEEAFPVRRS